MGANWSKCVQLQETAEELIPLHHVHLQTNKVKLVYRVCDNRPQEGGEDRLGGVDKVTGKDAFEVTGGEPCFRLWVPEWTLEDLDEDTFRGLVDHLLCQCGAGRNEDTGNVILSKERPDFAGFNANLGRFGLWHEKFQAAFEAMKGAGQLALPLDGPGAALEIAGMGVLGEDEDGSVPAEFRHQAPCGCVVDSRMGADCPIHGSAAVAAEQDAPPVLEVVEGGAATNGDGHQEAAPARRRVPRRALCQMTGEGDDASAAA